MLTYNTKKEGIMMSIIPIFMPVHRRNIELTYLPKSETQRQREYEERKQAEIEEQRRQEQKYLKRRKSIKLRNLKKINKQVKKYVFTISNFRALYDHAYKQHILSGSRLEKIKKIYKKMKKYSIYAHDLDIYKQEEKLNNETVENCPNNTVTKGHFQEDKTFKFNAFANYSYQNTANFANQQQPRNEHRLVKTLRK